MPLLLNGKTLTFVTTTRYLGVIIDQHLTWKAHVSYVLKKARYKLFALNRLKPLPDNLLCQLYQAFVLPVFDYCDAVWTPTSVLLTKHLEHIHSDFLKGISACSSYVKLTLAERRRFHTAVQVFKVLHHLFPRYLKDWFVSTEAYTGRTGRNKHQLYVLQIHSSIGKSSFYYCGVLIWNSLPPNLCGTDRLSNFKATYKQLCCTYLFCKFCIVLCKYFFVVVVY